MIPIIILSITGILLLYAGFLKNKKILVPIAIAGLFSALVSTLMLWNHPTSYFNDMMHHDNFSVAFSASLIFTTILILLFADSYFKDVQKNIAEIYTMILFSLTGAVVMTAFSNIAMLFIGIETMSIPLYILAGSKKFSIRSNEASFKYFILGSFATAVFLLGVTLVYGATATFNIHAIADYISANPGNIHPMFYTGLLFIIISFAFKIGAAPFHFWVPDVYEGSPTLTTTFMATVVKTASIAAFYRFFSVSFSGISEFWQITIWGIIVLTLLVGNLGAIRQEGFKRMMAYSGISHTAFLLLPIISLNVFSAGSILFYSVIYSAASTAIFGIFMHIKNNIHGKGLNEEFNGLAKTNPFLAFILVVALLSLAGIPITAGFFAKYYVLLSAIKSGFFWLAIISIIFAVVAVYYYLQIVISVYFKQGAIPTLPSDIVYKTSLIISLIIILLLGVYPALLMGLKV